MDDTTRLDAVGSVKVSEDVVAGIAGVAAQDVSGVHALCSRGEFRDLMGRRGAAKGVRIDMADNEARIELAIVVEYGCKVDEVASNVQKSVKRAIESMAGVRVSAVNVHVQSIHMPPQAAPAAEAGAED